MLNIIMTSWNRPILVKRAIESVCAQTSDDWQLIIQDDGSDKRTWNVVKKLAGKDERITAATRKVSDEERQQPARYSILINEILPTLTDGYVAYMCDNVEYAPETVATVLDWFSANPIAFAGYVVHERDVWQRDGVDGTKRLGMASSWGHWDILPPNRGALVDYPRGYLDHSQVFHRLPTDLRWPEIDPADGLFFEQLVQTSGPILPISAKSLTMEHLLK